MKNTAFLLPVLFLFTGCDFSEDEIIIPPLPAVESFKVESSFFQPGLNAIVIEFNTKINPESLNSDNFQIEGDNGFSFSGNFSYDPDGLRTIVVTCPAQYQCPGPSCNITVKLLDVSNKYVLSVDGAILDGDGDGGPGGDYIQVFPVDGC